MCGDVVEVPKMHRSETGFGPSLSQSLTTSEALVKIPPKSSSLQKSQIRTYSVDNCGKIPRSSALLLGAAWGVGLCTAFSSPASLRPLRTHFPARLSSLRGGSASTITMSDATSALKAQKLSWQQTMLRIKDPKKSVAFYEKHFGMKLVDKLEFPEYKFDLYFMESIPAGTAYNLTPGSDEAHKYLWTMGGTTLELTHNYGTESDDAFKHHPGNQEKDGFGHIAFNTADVYAASAKLEELPRPRLLCLLPHGKLQPSCSLSQRVLFEGWESSPGHSFPIR